jgi:hypothetical protein
MVVRDFALQGREIAASIGAKYRTTLHLGMDAGVEKGRWSTRVAANCVNLQVRDHDSAAVLREIVAELACARSSRSEPPATSREIDASSPRRG